jgi:hypothetical protein
MAEPAAEPEIVSGREAFAGKLAEMMAQAQSELALLSLQLGRRIYARTEVLEALQQFALRSPRSRLRVLVADARGATTGGNLFLEFARKLPSRIHLRELTPERRETEGPERLIADGRSLLDLPGQERLEATYYPHAAPRVIERIKEFEMLWDEAEPVLELSGMRL